MMKAMHKGEETSVHKTNVVVIMDGAADHLRIDGQSPLEMAYTPHLDYITSESAMGLMQTLYDDLPRDSVVAQLGLLGYDPYRYFPTGRSYFEVPDKVVVESNDLIFRVNLVAFDAQKVLKSYNGEGISTEEARKVVNAINLKTRDLFPDFHLYNNSAFRNTLIIKNAGKFDFKIKCWEPHEEEGRSFLNQDLITAPVQHPLVDRINDYISFIYQNTGNSAANGIFPWGYSYEIDLPEFSRGLKGCIIGNMDFLNGFCKKMNLDFYKVGNGDWDTDYMAKGRLLKEQINKGTYDFIFCHINGPDEASHINDVEKKVFSIEQIDEHILGPLSSFLENTPERFSSVAICPDHYTNINLKNKEIARRDAHSLDPVPFIVWNNEIKDDVTSFSERNAEKGYYGDTIYNHLDLLRLMNFDPNRIIQEKTSKLGIAHS